VNLHSQLSRLRRDFVNFVSSIYDHTDFTMPNALSIFSIVVFSNNCKQTSRCVRQNDDPYGNIIFSILFLLCFFVQSFAATIE